MTRDVYSFVNRQLAVTSGMNTASGDCGGTGGSSESSVNATCTRYKNLIKIKLVM